MTLRKMFGWIAVGLILLAIFRHPIRCFLDALSYGSLGEYFAHFFDDGLFFASFKPLFWLHGGEIGITSEMPIKRGLPVLGGLIEVYCGMVANAIVCFCYGVAVWLAIGIALDFSNNIHIVEGFVSRARCVLSLPSKSFFYPFVILFLVTNVVFSFAILAFWTVLV